MTAYTVGGVITSSAVGAALGLVGHAALPGPFLMPALTVAAAVAALGVVREMDLVAFAFPQARRQTTPGWAKRFSTPVPEMLWGLDLGLTFTTWSVFSGAWVIAVIALTSANTWFALTLFVSYWLGRALAVWVAPLLVDSANGAPVLASAADQQFALFRFLHAITLTTCFLALAVLLVS